MRTLIDLSAIGRCPWVTELNGLALPDKHPGRLRHVRLHDGYADLTVLRGVTLHSFRRTVATKIDEVDDAEAAKNQLGHTSKTVTERHPINRKLVVPDCRAATESLAPGSGSGHGVGPPSGPGYSQRRPAPSEETALSVLRVHDWPWNPTDALRARLQAILHALTPRYA